jgi:glyoxylase-like metal-dependent hydrolase (beta-lactamase superfamily II)
MSTAKCFNPTIGIGIFSMEKINMPQFFIVIFLTIILLTGSSCSKDKNPFDHSALVNPGDTVRYGSYVIYKIGDGVYMINDPGDPKTIKGGLGVDMFMICGTKKALMIDLGNNYTDGYEKDLIPPRKNAADELRNVVYGLAGKLPLEIAVTHMHPDHDGMTGAFLNSDALLWIGEGEDLARLTADHRLDPSVYKVFKHGEKTFDLGGGRSVETFLVRGHSNGGTVFILKPDGIIISGDCFYGNNINFAVPQLFKDFTEDMQKFGEYVYTNFTPYERYALKVYRGHMGNTIYSKGRPTYVDAGYLDWRFVQNLTYVAKGIVKGSWLDKSSQLNYVERMPEPAGSGEKLLEVSFQLARINMPVTAAYNLAGLSLPAKN